MITDIKDYFSKGCGRCTRFATPDCSALLHRRGLEALRAVCRASGLEETLRWAHPCYRHVNRNIAIIGAFQADFRLSFFNAALMADPANLLEKPGPNTQHPCMIRFTSAGDVARLAPLVRDYLEEAKGYAEAGIKPPPNDSALALPEELVEALDADPELAEAFQALTPGRQRSYVILLNGAKKPETRFARIARVREKIFTGKGAQEP